MGITVTYPEMTTMFPESWRFDRTQTHSLVHINNICHCLAPLSPLLHRRPNKTTQVLSVISLSDVNILFVLLPAQIIGDCTH